MVKNGQGKLLILCLLRGRGLEEGKGRGVWCVGMGIFDEMLGGRRSGAPWWSVKVPNHKNGEKMPQTLMSTLVDCYFPYV